MERPTCRLCRLSVGPLVRACRCAPPEDLVHRHCLATWVHVCRLTRCPFCRHRFHILPYDSCVQRFRAPLLLLLLLPVIALLTGAIFFLLTMWSEDSNMRPMLIVVIGVCILAIIYILYLLVYESGPERESQKMRVREQKETERTPILSAMAVV